MYLRATAKRMRSFGAGTFVRGEVNRRAIDAHSGYRQNRSGFGATPGLEFLNLHHPHAQSDRFPHRPLTFFAPPTDANPKIEKPGPAPWAWSLPGFFGLEEENFSAMKASLAVAPRIDHYKCCKVVYRSPLIPAKPQRGRAIGRRGARGRDRMRKRVISGGGTFCNGSPQRSQFVVSGSCTRT